MLQDFNRCIHSSCCWATEITFAICPREKIYSATQWHTHNTFPKVGWAMPASMTQVTETQCAPTKMVYRRSLGLIPGSAGRFRVWISGAHALRLISQAGKEGSTVSSIICDSWLILS